MSDSIEYNIDFIDENNEPIEIEMASDDPIEMEIVQGDVEIINSDRLEKEFTFEDWSAGKLKIGNDSSEFRNEKISVIVEDGDEFDEGTITIGDESAHGRLMVAADCDLTKAEQYHKEPDYQYSTNTDVYVYFETGSPTKGKGTIIIYLK